MSLECTRITINECKVYKTLYAVVFLKLTIRNFKISSKKSKNSLKSTFLVIFYSTYSVQKIKIAV